MLAAGSGTTFGAEKQFVTIAGHRPVGVAVATALSTCDEIVLVRPDAGAARLSARPSRAALNPARDDGWHALAAGG